MKIEKTELRGVYIKELTGKQLIEFMEFTEKIGDMTPSQKFELACFLLSMAVCDKDGTPLYTTETAKDLPVSQINTLIPLVNMYAMGETSNLKNAQKDSSTTS